MPPREMSTARTGSTWPGRRSSAWTSHAKRGCCRLLVTPLVLLARRGTTQRLQHCAQLLDARASQGGFTRRRFGLELALDGETLPLVVQADHRERKILAQLGQPHGFPARPQLLGIERQPVQAPGRAPLHA